MGIPDHITCLLRNLYAGQEATVRTGHGMMDWFKLGKEYVKDVLSEQFFLLIYFILLSHHSFYVNVFFFKLDKKFLDVRGHPSMLLCFYLETGTG